MNDSKDQLISLLQHLEDEIGPISQAQRALISTDGSVTRLLEVFSSDPVGVHTISQEIISAPEEIAGDLEISPGDEVNCRVVNLISKRTQKILIQAISYAPLKRLPDQARIKLMKADEPIGIILRDEKMESRRELLSVRHFKKNKPWNQVNEGVPGPLSGKDQIHISRTYRIIHNNHPIFRIEEVMPVSLFAEKKSITIRTPSRLHLGLIDMNGSTGRVDGGAGITLDNPGFEIEFSKSDTFSINAPDQEVTHKISTLISRLYGNETEQPSVEITVHTSIPFHAGLGSGTQLALALVSGISCLNGETFDTESLIRKTGRGGTSGIGVRAFADGGLIVDAGHRFGKGKVKCSFTPSAASQGVKPAPIIGRYDFPKDWKIVLAIPDGLSGSQGESEKEIFKRCCPVPLDEVQALSHLVMMKLIPSVIEHDLDEFGAAINGFSEYGFKRCELDLQPPVVRGIMEAMRESGAAGAGMSSFGPVVYGITDTNGRGIQSAAEEIMQVHNGGKTLVTSGRNRGYEIVS